MIGFAICFPCLLYQSTMQVLRDVLNLNTPWNEHACKRFPCKKRFKKCKKKNAEFECTQKRRYMLS